MKKFMKTGDYYLRIETYDDIEYHIFGDDYQAAVIYCQKCNIDIKNIKKWVEFFL
jgi:hypothetical protein